MGRVVPRVRQVFKGGNFSFMNLEIVANSNSCRNTSIFYLINEIFAAETNHWEVLTAETNQWRKIFALKKETNLLKAGYTSLLLIS